MRLNPFLRPASLLLLAALGASAQAVVVTFSGIITSAAQQTFNDPYPRDLDPTGMTFSGVATSKGITMNYSFGGVQLPAFHGQADADDRYLWFASLTTNTSGFTASYYEEFLPLYYVNGSDSPYGGDLNRYQVELNSSSIFYRFDSNYEGTFQEEDTFRGIVTSYTVSAPGPAAALPFVALALKRRRKAV